MIQPYLDEATAMTLHSGRLGVKGDVSYAADARSRHRRRRSKAKFEWRMCARRTSWKEDFVKWRSLAVTGIDFSMNPDKLDINRIVARQPYGKVVIAKDTTLNVTQVLSPRGAKPPATDTEQQETTRGRRRHTSDTKPAAAEETAQRQRHSKQAAAEDGASERPRRRQAKDEAAAAGTEDAGDTKQAAASAPMFPVKIKTVQIIDGSANFADYSIEPSFASGILELNGTITGLSSDPKSRAKVKLDGKVDKYAPVDISGEVNLLAATAYTRPRDELPKHGADHVQSLLGQVRRLQHQQGQVVDRAEIPGAGSQARGGSSHRHRQPGVRRQDRLERRRADSVEAGRRPC